MFPEPPSTPGVVVLGPWPHSLAVEALRRSLFTVAPSIWPEPFGLVALEAAAAGKAIVASGTGGLRDVVADGETGLLVRPGDRDEFAGRHGRRSTTRACAPASARPRSPRGALQPGRDRPPR